MPSPDESIANTVAIEMSPGWVYVKIVEPKPEPDRVELLLRLTIDQWFSTRPHYVIDKTQAVTEHGALQGVNVWYHVNDGQREPVNPEHPQRASALSVGVHGQIHQRVPKEYIEADIEDAIQMWRSRPDWNGSTVVINPRRVAVILDKQANRGAMLPVELIYPAIEESTRIRVLTWLEALPTRRHVILIDGSWFLPRTTESQGQIAEAGSGHANMTYDRGKGGTQIAEPCTMPTNMTYDPRPRPKD